MSGKKTTLSLTMIVKNETGVITRLFDSVAHHLDYWVIHDTGSTDGTPELIQKYFAEKGIKGELHHTPWKNFGYNRSKAIADTKDKADYTLLLDADFILNTKDPDFKQKLGAMNADGYLLRYEGGLDYRQNLCVRTALNWFYKGVTHEFIHTPEAKKIIAFDGISITHKADGGCRSDKFERDVQLLEDGLKEEPDNGRYYFYLGQSYKDLGGINKNQHDYKRRLIDEFRKKIEALSEEEKKDEQYVKMQEQLDKMEGELPELKEKYLEFLTKSLEPYRKRAEMGGWGEEVYYSWLQRGLAKMRRGDDFYEFMPELLRAFMYRPVRLEALFHLIRYCRLHNMAPLGYHLAKMAENNPYPRDLLFIDKGIHDWGFWDEFALCAHLCGKADEAVAIGQRILNEKKYPEKEEPRLKRNVDYYLKGQVVKNQKEAAEATNPLRDVPVTEKKVEKKEPVEISNTPTSAPASTQEFVRIKPEVKEGRVALIIANYNMVERADQIAEYVKKNVEYPTDVILVDNGSDQVDQSKYTSLALGRNVQTTHAWLMGLNYADSLEVFEEFKYRAYGFIITSSEVVEGQGDIISQLMKGFDDPDTVGVHPALTTDSTTWWKHLIHRTDGSGFRYTNMIDNIFSFYRADWFNQQGRFDKSLTYAWGIDMETSYFARRDGKKLLINDDVQVKKVTNVGYKMDRMGMTSDDRFNNAREQIEVYFTKKYGPKYNDTVSKKYRVPEFLRVNSDIDHIRKNYNGKEGGHRAMIEYVFDHEAELKQKFASEGQINLVEVGCNREEWIHLNSTYKLSKLCEHFNYDFWSIDVDTDAMTSCKRMVTYPKFHPVNERAEKYLPDFPGKIHLLYLDGYDVTLSANHHNAERKQKYLTYLGEEMNNISCYQMHLDTVRHVDERMAVGGLICFNDVINQTDFQLKGRTAIPYLLRSGRYVVKDNKFNTLMLEKISDESLSHRSLNPKAVVNSDPKKRFIVTLLGYTSQQPRHTNWYPWNRFLDVYQTMGYDAEWIEIAQLVGRAQAVDPRPRIFICWNSPTCVELVKSGALHHNDVIIQKLTSLGKGMEHVNWGDNPTEYFKKWHWPIYQTVEYLLESGYNIYAFGCHTHSEDFPEKQRIVKKLEKFNRLFWINWGSTVFNYEEIKNCKPMMDNLTYDIGYVGSKWGRAGRGNTDQWDAFIQPIVNQYGDNLRAAFYGSGFPEGQISDAQAQAVLKQSKICPILHAPSWIAEKGIQDRFYTVFTAGRFGVVDNPGVLDFFTKDEVVVETDPQKYIEKTIYFMQHPEEQLPYIEKVQEKIRTKYNLYTEWDDILTKIITDQQEYQSDSYEFLSKVNNIWKIEKPFYEKAI